jgi:hypothetical protein
MPPRKLTSLQLPKPRLLECVIIFKIMANVRDRIFRNCMWPNGIPITTCRWYLIEDLNL